jgi:2Fe-2S ferredoxin
MAAAQLARARSAGAADRNLEEKMPEVTFLKPDGSSVKVEVEDGTSVMRAAIYNGIDGIVGDCGGVMSCATCHVLVEERFLPLLPAMLPNEDDMLDCTAAEREPGSRLSCQIVMTEALDGLIVRIADPQI